MTVQPELAVVICCYNSEKIIEETLRALAAQEDIGSVWEVVLVDNNCNDQTTTVAKATWEDSGSSRSPTRTISMINKRSFLNSIAKPISVIQFFQIHQKSKSVLATNPAMQN